MVDLKLLSLIQSFYRGYKSSISDRKCKCDSMDRTLTVKCPIMY